MTNGVQSYFLTSPGISSDYRFRISFEQMVTCEVLVQCFGFGTISPQTLRNFVGKLLELREHGLLKLLYSAGVDPTWNDESMIGISADENDRELYRWIKRLRTNPRSLKDLCRKRIRWQLSSNVLQLVRRLDRLPEELREYVCIMDTQHYSVQVPEDNGGNAGARHHGNNNLVVKDSPNEEGEADVDTGVTTERDRSPSDTEQSRQELQHVSEIVDIPEITVTAPELMDISGERESDDEQEQTDVKSTIC